MFYSLVLLSSALLLLSSCAEASNQDVYDAYKERNQELNNILAMSMDRGSRKPTLFKIISQDKKLVSKELWTPTQALPIKGKIEIICAVA